MGDVETEASSAACPADVPGSKVRHPSPIIPAFLVMEGPTRSGVNSKHRVIGEFGGEPFFWKFDTVAPHTRKRISSASRSGRTALTWMVSRGGCGGATTGFAVKSNGIPSTSAYSTLNNPLFSGRPRSISS